MKRLFVLIFGFCMALLPACGELGDSTSAGRTMVSEEFLEAVPDPELFQIALPLTETGGAGLTFWRLTRGQASLLNNASAEIAEVMDALRPYPPSQYTAENVVWELQSAVGQNPVLAPRFSVAREAEGTFRYSLAQRNIPLNGSWVEVFTGQMERDPERPRWGLGSFELNYTALAQADSSQWRRGRMGLAVNETEEEGRHLRYTFSDYLADTETGGEARNFIVDYYQDGEGGGRFNYATWFNWIGTEKPESFVIKNRWKPNGAGVAQVLIRGEEITERRLDLVEIRECWSASFTRTYYVQFNHWSAVGNNRPEPTRDSERGNPDACVFPFESTLER